MRQAMVAGKWKLNGSVASVQSLSSEIASALVDGTSVEVVVCPVFIHLREVLSCIASSPVKLGAQDACDEDSGAYTGEVSAPMLAECRCEYVIIGHSERRAIYAESDRHTAAKFVAVQRANLTPILCIGEQFEEREKQLTEVVVGRQLDAVIELAGVRSLASAVIAYEPVWAIGTGKTATRDQAQAVHKFIRGKIADLDSGVAQSVRILYGGSVKPTNARELFEMEDIDGGLIGGAALNSDDFVAICRAAEQSAA